MKTILHLCADTGSDSWFYQREGYEVILVGKDIGVENYTPDRPIYGIIANPPCTEFSIARPGGKARNPKEGMKLVRECYRIIKEAQPKFWVIENPATGELKNHFGEPDYIYQPWWYGSPWTKKTALWGNFNIPQRKYFDWEDVPKIPELYVRQNTTKHNRATGKPQMYQLNKSAFDLIPEFSKLPRPTSAMEFRSLCSQKFAQAFYEANK